MTDLLGPGQNCPFVVTARPADSRTFGGVNSWFGDCSRVGANDGTFIQASLLNGLLGQLRSVIAAAPAVAINNADDTMLLQAIRDVTQTANPVMQFSTPASAGAQGLAPTPPAGATGRYLDANLGWTALPASASSPQLTGAVTTTGAGQGATTLSAGVVAAGNMAAGAAVGNLGYTPVNRAGDTMTGSLTVPRLQLGAGQSAVFYDPTAAADSKTFDQYTQNGLMVFRAVNDAYSAANAWLIVSRTGITPILNWGAQEIHNGTNQFNALANLSGGALVPTMPAGDATNNAATTAFVTNALANAVPPGCKTFVLADSEGSCVGGSLVITSTTATITFSTPQPDTNYNVWGTCFGVGPQKKNSGATIGPIYATDIVRNATLTKSTVKCIFTFPQQVATDPTTGISTAATLSTFSLSIAR